MSSCSPSNVKNSEGVVDTINTLTVQNDETHSTCKANESLLSTAGDKEVNFETVSVCDVVSCTADTPTVDTATASHLPATADTSVASRIPHFAPSLPSTQQTHNGNNHLLPNANIAPSTMLLLQTQQKQQPLVVDSALLRHRQLAHQQKQQKLPTYPHLRSGKWLPAEENYALLLVALFERGMIQDCVDGATTLRTYLSQKLHCAPMRISKKFAGRGIGKLVYTSKPATTTSSAEQQKLPELIHRLRIAEQQFLLAAYPPPVAASMGLVPYSLLQVPPTLPQPIPVFPPAIMPGMVANPNARQSVPQLVIPMVVGSSSTQEVHTSELHKSYLRALEEQADDDVSNVALQNKTSPQSVAEAIPQAPVSNVLQVNPVPIVSQAIAVMPDLLSGFEKVVQGMKDGAPMRTHPIAALPINATNDYSPPFTSRSFDEFHRFLGKDEISLLDTTMTAPIPDPLYVNQNSHVTTTTMDCETILPTPAIPLDTDALFIAESYAMLSEECSGTNFISLSSVGRNHCGVENILQQVHTNRNNHELPRQSETMSTHSSFYDAFPTNSPLFHGNSYTNPPTDVTISHRSATVGPLSSPPNFSASMVTSTVAPVPNRNRHVTASSHSEDVNIVSGSEPSGGSSSSRSNTSNASSGTDTAGTTSNEDDGSEEDGLTSSGGEFDSAEDDDHNNVEEQSPSLSPNSPPRKRVKGNSKHQKRGEHWKPKKVQFQQ